MSEAEARGGKYWKRLVSARVWLQMREFDVSTVVEGRTFARMVAESEAEVCGALVGSKDLGEGDGECNVVAAAGSIC
jgi:hypothetical protein